MEKQDATSSFARNAEVSIPAIWQVGDTILDLYEITGILGQGGMGKVYKVHHRGWNIELAVKSPKPEIFASASGKENFEREAETWVKLGLHPHIVSCYYVRTLGSIPRVFAEYVAGGSLSDWIRTRRLYKGGHEKALERIFDVAIQFAWGLHYAHEQGLIHQDIKPANVMMTTDGTAKVTDFGLAKARAAGEVGVQGIGQSILVSWGGMTPAYCSPEQSARQPLSHKTDIWSWGVSVLEMFVGGVTWLAGSVAREALTSYQRQDAAIPSMPTEVVKLLARCFRSRPEDRPATMLEVATTLQTSYARLAGHPYPREVPKPTEVRADSLNNRALSLFDLGKVEEAKQVWKQALQADPYHLEATYNQGLVLWRQGWLTDDGLVRQLEGFRYMRGGPWQVLCLLAQVHLERADVDTALLLLKEAAPLAPTEKEVQVLLGLAQSGKIPTGQCLRTFQGHYKSVDSVSLSADGRFALSGGHDYTLRLWEVATGRCLRTFQGHTQTVWSVSLSADGRFALSGSSDRAVRLWEVSTGRCLHIFQGHTGRVESVSLSADGRFALSGSADKTMRLWEAASGHCLHVLQEHTSVVSSVSLSADGRFALSGSSDGTMRLWEVTSGRCLHIFQEHTYWVTSVSLSVDGRLAFSGSIDGTMRQWEVTTGHLQHTLSQGHKGRVESVSLSADGRLALSSGSLDETMRLWEVATGRCLHTFQGHTDEVTSVSLSADGSLALSGSKDKTVRLWQMPREHFLCPLHLSRVRSHADLSQIESHAEALLKQAEQACQETHFAVAVDLLREVRALLGWERTLKGLEAWKKLSLHCARVSLRASWLVRTFEGHTHWVHAVSLSADGSLALSASSDSSDIRLWEVVTGRCLRTFQGHTKGVDSVSLSADGRLALSGSQDKTVRLWEVASGRCLHILQGHKYPVESVNLSVDGRFALSGSVDYTLRLWEVATERCLRTFQGHTNGVASVSLSVDGRFALSGSSDGTMRLWEVATGRCLRTFQEHTDEVTSVSLSVDGSLALSGSKDKTVRLWEVATGRCLRTFQEHTDEVTSVSLSVDGRLALSGSKDGTVRLWEVATGRCLHIFQGHTDWVTSVSLSADGRFALSGSVDKTVRLWELDWELEACDLADWDEGALPYVETFLTQHTPYAGDLPHWHKPFPWEIQHALTRRGRPTWNEQDFQDLIRQLQYAGYGWLRPQGVRRKLEGMAASWQGPPPLLGV